MRYVFSGLAALIYLGSGMAAAQTVLPSDTEQSLPDLPSISQMQRISGEELRAAIVDRQRIGIYSWTSETRNDPAFREIIYADGTMYYSDSSDPGSGGRWTIIGDTICFNHLNPHIGGPHCFAEFRSGNCFVSVGSSGFYQNEYLARDWNSISVFEGESFNCVPEMV